jgi:hypothetical protein
MPLRPKKCMGKKVKLTPTNNNQKTPKTRELLKVLPEKRGNQRENPQRIPKTAPKERTK